MSSVQERAANWIVGHDTGASSKTIWAVMMGVGNRDASHPHDPSDFGRCHRLLIQLPEWRERLEEMVSVSAYWKALVARWDEIEALYKVEAALPFARKTYDLMRSILDPVTDADPRVIRLGKGWTIRTST